MLLLLLLLCARRGELALPVRLDRICPSRVLSVSRCSRGGGRHRDGRRVRSPRKIGGLLPSVCARELRAGLQRAGECIRVRRGLDGRVVERRVGHGRRGRVGGCVHVERIRPVVRRGGRDAQRRRRVGMVVGIELGGGGGCGGGREVAVGVVVAMGGHDRRRKLSGWMELRVL